MADREEALERVVLACVAVMQRHLPPDSPWTDKQAQSHFYGILDGPEVNRLFRPEDFEGLNPPEEDRT